MANRRRNAATPPDNHDPFRDYVTKALERLVALGEVDAHWREEQERRHEEQERRWEEERRRWEARWELEDKRWEHQLVILGGVRASIDNLALAIDELRKTVHEDRTSIGEAFSANTAVLRELLAELVRRREQTSSGGDGSGGSPAP